MESTPLDTLRDQTRELHERIDGGPYARAVLDGSLAIHRYESFLRALHVVHRALEQAVEDASSPMARAAYVNGVERRSRLEADLTFLQCDLRRVDASLLHALVLAQHIRLDARAGSALWGHLYVLEGSQLGGLLQRQALSARPELQQGGLAYLSGAGRETQAQFKAFATRLNAALAEPSALAEAVAAARRCFQGFAHIVASIMEEASAQWLSGVLNPDAGTHPVPRDLREVQAALQAGERSWYEAAYYMKRYGERGLAFTRSDSCWLATLARDSPETVQKQVAWLAHVLARRGMPRLLLERHLVLLHDTLSQAVPEHAGQYRLLRDAADSLAQARLAQIDDERSTALIAGFVEALEGASSNPATAEALSPREAGTLLVAAVSDEKSGVSQAVESLCAWLGDPALFSARWRSALQQTLREARGGD